MDKITQYNVIDGGVTAAKGYQAAGVEAHVKYSNRKDMAMIYSSKPCVVAGTFTTNVVKAAPVKWDMNVVENSAFAQAVVANSGIANACTSEEGYDACKQMADYAGNKLGIPGDSVLIGSTGVIGMKLPMDKIMAGIDNLSGSLADTRQAAKDAEAAIMTTDTVPKEVAVNFEIGGKTVTIGAMSKGSGMIHPNMCTMLAYVCSDVSITKEMLTKAVKEDIPDTFNMITVDGDTSTNDTFLCMANGMAENPTITEDGEDYKKFVAALHYVNETLAKKMAKDGEGATALFETKVINAATKEEAKIFAKSVVGSSLCKAAIYGHDANFGRFICALGYAGIDFDPEKVDMYFKSKAGSLLMYTNGCGTDFDEDEATEILSEDEVTVLVDMKRGDQSATAWGCDLTYDYVKINADYRS